MKTSIILKSKLLKDKIPAFTSILIIIILWKILSLRIRSELLLPPPEIAVKRFLSIYQTKLFWVSIWATFLRGMTGFLLSCAAGIIAGILSGIYDFIDKALQPFIVMIKSTPIMSVILLALIWFQTENVPIFASFLVAFPIICANVREGIRNIDKKLIEMAKIYQVQRKNILLEIYFPSILPFLTAGISTAVGIGWKVIVSAEVLGQPKYAIGTQLYTSKIYLETADVLAWTIAAVLLSALFEKSIRLLERKIIKWR